MADEQEFGPDELDGIGRTASMQVAVRLDLEQLIMLGGVLDDARATPDGADAVRSLDTLWGQRELVLDAETGVQLMAVLAASLSPADPRVAQLNRLDIRRIR